MQNCLFKASTMINLMDGEFSENGDVDVLISLFQNTKGKTFIKLEEAVKF